MQEFGHAAAAVALSRRAPRGLDRIDDGWSWDQGYAGVKADSSHGCSALPTHCLPQSPELPA
eukprot:496204-Alexandrium_andersonii.AAC.1